jgi:hypothetical protein
MPLVVTGLAAAIGDLDRADKHAGRKVTWLNMHPIELFGFAWFEARVNVNAHEAPLDGSDIQIAWCRAKSVPHKADEC